MTSPPWITHVIYDLDGILLDTEPIYTTLAQQILARYGKTFDLDLKLNTMGRRAQESAQYLVETLNLPISAETYLAERRALGKDLLPKNRPLSGAQDLTYHLASRGIPQAIATSSVSPEFDFKVSTHLDWLTCFQTIVCGDNPRIKQGKPAPDIFLLAAEILGADPAHCLVFEDAVLGVAAAREAGMSVIAIPAPHMPLSLFEKADQILCDFGGFVPEDWGLPPYAQSI